MRETVFVDVDDTLVRSADGKRMPISAAVRAVVRLKAAGADLYLWSSGGADYCRTVAEELGISECFTAFLPKPTIYFDDKSVAEWRLCRHVHPNEAANLADGA